MLQRLFTDHPSSVSETYWEHMAVAGSFSFRLMLGALVCLIHAVLPFLFVKTGSRIITDLHDTIVTNRSRKAPRSGPEGALQAAE